MTQLILVDGERGGTRNEAVVRRLREEFARLGGLSVSEAARRVGMTQQALQARMAGNVDFKVSELDEICATVGASFVYTATGIREIPARDDRPSDGASSSRRAGPTKRGKTAYTEGDSQSIAWSKPKRVS